MVYCFAIVHSPIIHCQRRYMATFWPCGRPKYSWSEEWLSGGGLWSALGRLTQLHDTAERCHGTSGENTSIVWNNPAITTGNREFLSSMIAPSAVQK